MGFTSGFHFRVSLILRSVDSGRFTAQPTTVCHSTVRHTDPIVRNRDTIVAECHLDCAVPGGACERYVVGEMHGIPPSPERGSGSDALLRLQRPPRCLVGTLWIVREPHRIGLQYGDARNPTLGPQITPWLIGIHRRLGSVEIQQTFQRRTGVRRPLARGNRTEIQLQFQPWKRYRVKAQRRDPNTKPTSGLFLRSAFNRSLSNRVNTRSVAGDGVAGVACAK